MQISEQCDESYPSNEEILHYVCGGYNLRSNEVMEFKKLPKVEEGLHTGNIEQAIHSTTSHNETKSLEEESLIDDINQQQSHRGVCDKDSNLQAMENNTAEGHPPSTVQKDKDNNSDSPHQCGSIIPIEKHSNSLQQMKAFSQCKKSHAYKTEIPNYDQLSLDSSNKLTETTLVYSVSSHDVNISLQEGEYIENKSPTHSVKDEIPMQSHNFRQNTVTHSDETFLTTTAIEGEYIDYNNAIQQN